MVKVSANFHVVWEAMGRPVSPRGIGRVNRLAESTAAPLMIGGFKLDSIWVHEDGGIAILYNRIPDVLARNLETPVVLCAGFCKKAYPKISTGTCVPVYEASPYCCWTVWDGLRLSSILAQLSCFDLSGCYHRVADSRVMISSSGFDLILETTGDITLHASGPLVTRRIR